METLVWKLINKTMRIMIACNVTEQTGIIATKNKMVKEIMKVVQDRLNIDYSKVTSEELKEYKKGFFKKINSEYTEMVLSDIKNLGLETIWIDDVKKKITEEVEVAVAMKRRGDLNDLFLENFEMKKYKTKVESLKKLELYIRNDGFNHIVTEVVTGRVIASGRTLKIVEEDLGELSEEVIKHCIKQIVETKNSNPNLINKDEYVERLTGINRAEVEVEKIEKEKDEKIEIEVKRIAEEIKVAETKRIKVEKVTKEVMEKIGAEKVIEKVTEEIGAEVEVEKINKPEPIENVKLIKEINTLSSGTLAKLFNENRYEELEKIKDEWIEKERYTEDEDWKKSYKRWYGSDDGSTPGIGKAVKKSENQEPGKEKIEKEKGAKEMITRAKLEKFLESGHFLNEEDKLLYMLLFLGYGNGKYEPLVELKKEQVKGDVLIGTNGEKIMLDQYTKKIIDKVLKNDYYYYYGESKSNGYEVNKESGYVFSSKINTSNPFGLKALTPSGLRTRFKNLRVLSDSVEMDISFLRTSHILERIKKSKDYESWTVNKIVIYLAQNNIKANANRIYQALKD